MHLIMTQVVKNLNSSSTIYVNILRPEVLGVDIHMKIRALQSFVYQWVFELNPLDVFLWIWIETPNLEFTYLGLLEGSEQWEWWYSKRMWRNLCRWSTCEVLKDRMIARIYWVWVLLERQGWQKLVMLSLWVQESTGSATDLFSFGVLGFILASPVMSSSHRVGRVPVSFLFISWNFSFMGFKMEHHIML